jgi:cytidine deaminase
MTGSPFIDVPRDALPPEQRAAIAAAIAVSRNAHAPYSRFRVGAAALLADGSLITGCNFENISYGLSLCAETVALATANSAGKLGDVVLIAVIAEGDIAGVDAPPVIAPCGRCRQVIAEAAGISGRDIEVLMLARDGTTVRCAKISALLPLAFASQPAVDGDGK